MRAGIEGAFGCWLFITVFCLGGCARGGVGARLPFCLSAGGGSWGPMGVGRSVFGVGSRAGAGCAAVVASVAGLHLPERERLRERERERERDFDERLERLRDEREELCRRRRRSRSRERERVRDRRRRSRERERERERRPPRRYLPPRPRPETTRFLLKYSLIGVCSDNRQSKNGAQWRVRPIKNFEEGYKTTIRYK